ncbi:hypothetical protein ABPG72_011218 [Tetrahymena utriculariae]
MPPKTKKELEAEALRLAEEQRLREEEERKRKEEEKKKYEVKILDTGLECIFTDYYVTECYENSNDPRQFTKEFLQNYYFRENNYSQNFREIDWITLIEFTLYNLNFAKNELNLTNQQSKIFINIMFDVLRLNDLKYTTFTLPKTQNERGEEVDLEEKEREKYITSKVRLQGQKTKQKDFEHLKNLFINHSVDQPPNKLKFFSSDQLQQMFIYANNSYFAHYNLYCYIQRKEQRQVDIFQTVYVDQMVDIPPLEQGLFVPIDKKDEEQLERERRQFLQQQLEEEQALEALKRKQEEQGQEEEEEPLDPIALEIIREKVKETEQIMQQKLFDRQNALNEKLQELDKPKKPVKK